jgi:hypothetical protein
MNKRIKKKKRRQLILVILGCRVEIPTTDLSLTLNSYIQQLLSLQEIRGKQALHFFLPIYGDR